MYVNGIDLLSSVQLTDRWSAGLTLSTQVATSNSASINQSMKTQNLNVDSFADVCFRVARPVAITVGASRTQYYRDDDDQDGKAYQWGYGATATWHRPGALFSSPAVGFHYLQETRENLFLVSTSFY
jgi:hypothetical protein